MDEASLACWFPWLHGPLCWHNANWKTLVVLCIAFIIWHWTIAIVLLQQPFSHHRNPVFSCNNVTLKEYCTSSKLRDCRCAIVQSTSFSCALDSTAVLLLLESLATSDRDTVCLESLWLLSPTCSWLGSVSCYAINASYDRLQSVVTNCHNSLVWTVTYLTVL